VKNERIDLREALIREAIGLLGDGPADLSLRSVARAAGVSAMAPYRHFADKAALLGAVAAKGFAELRDVLEVADARAEGGAALVEQGLAYIAFAQRRPSLFRLMFASADLACIPKPAGMSAYAVLARRVASVAPDSSEVSTLGCWAMVHGLAILRLDRRIEAGSEADRSVLMLLTEAIVGR
jgi:AcrR family transcriptional regulator